MEEYCDFSDLPKTSCSHCLGITDERDIKTRSKQGEPWFPASYRGMCVECGYPIEEGEPIAHFGDGYIHRGCD
jgi:hypothetical protein